MHDSDWRARLERLLRYRRACEDRAHARAEERRGDLEAARRRLDQLRRELAECRSGVLPVSRGTASGLAGAHRYAGVLAGQIEEAADEVRDAEAALANARQALVTAGQRRLAVERLLDETRNDARRRGAAASQAEMDEHARMRMTRDRD